MMYQNICKCGLEVHMATHSLIIFSITNSQVVELQDLGCAPIKHGLALLDACSSTVHLALKNGIILQ
jgi:predicted ATPase